MTNWPHNRRVMAALAILAAILTGAFGVESGGPAWAPYAAGTYLLITLIALFSPAAVAVQVIAGQTLIGGLLVAQDGGPPLILFPAVAGVILTAELLSVVARMDTPFDSDPRSDLPRAGLAALIGGGVFGAVVLLSGLPGPTGLVAFVLASGVCVLLAAFIVIVGKVGWPGRSLRSGPAGPTHFPFRPPSP